MANTAATTATYRKTKKGKWVVMAPASALRPGGTITVTKKGGATKTESIESVGKPFEARGTTMAYGYIAERNGRSTARQARAATRRSGGRACQDCGGPVQSWSDGAADALCHDCV